MSATASGIASILLLSLLQAEPKPPAPIEPAAKETAQEQAIKATLKLSESQLSQEAEEVLVLKAKTMSVETANAFAMASEEQRAAGLRKYLDAKRILIVGTGSEKVEPKDLADFDWIYATRDDLRYGTLCSYADKRVAFDKVIGKGWELNVDVSTAEPGKQTLLYPFVPDEETRLVTDDGKTITIAGSVQNEPIEFRWDFVRRVQITIDSDPDECDVFFNGKPFHSRTNTKVVQEPGKWEVRIVKDGYEPYVETRDAKAGTVWKIEAKLERKP